MTATHQVTGVSFSAEELERRRQRLNASELPAVLGLDRYRTPHAVYLEKKGLIAPFEGNEHTEWGLRLEPVLRQKTAEVLGIADIRIPGSLACDAEPWLYASPDGLFTDDEGEPTVLEMKNKTERQLVHWGDAGTDQIPFDVASQTYGQMIVTGARRATVAVLFGKSDFRLYHLRRDDAVAKQVLDGARHFWFDFVEANVEPPIEAGGTTAEWLKERFKQLTEVLRPATRAEHDLVVALRAVRDQIADLEFRESGVVNKLKAAIGEDAGIQCSAGRVTWKATKPSTHIDWQAIAMDLHGKLGLVAELLRNPDRLALYTSDDGAGARALALDFAGAIEQASKQYTTQKPGVRRFVPTFSKE